jgi:aryl-alcohol dehydrogenase-like predicted oxidoreductase
MPMLTRRLGRTDHLSSIAILGGAAFWNTSAFDTEAAFELAIAAGVNHIDIAPSYGNAELAAGPLVAAHRDRLFVAEKSGRKNPDGLRSEMATSLERLGCDHFDLYQAHGVTDLAELDRRSDAIEAILLARDEGLTRFVGITGHDHGTPAAQLAALRRFDLDTVMFPIYPGVMNNAQYAHDVAALLHECAERDTGVMAIKSVAHQPIRFVLSNPGVHAICTPGDVSLLPSVFAAATAFEPMTDVERDAALHDGADWPTVFPLAEHARG